MSKMRVAGFAVAAVVAVSVSALAEESVTNAFDAGREPKWELGVGIGAVRMADYRGADEYREYVLPFPYFVYRGEIVRADRNGVSTFFLRTDHWQSDVSFGGNPPVSSDNKARAGMERLGALLEFGPALYGYLLPRKSDRNVFVSAAARGAAALDPDGGLPYEGLRGGLAGGAYWRQRGGTGWLFGTGVGVDLSDRKYNRYFYQVEPEDERAGRAAYDPPGGYGGMNVSAFGAWDINSSVSVMAFARWENLRGTAFGDSPLVREEDNVTVFAALSWSLMQSRKTVPIAEVTGF
jgi:outer membrane scaffolding protein for murein synthesis (MipA/OmpV family)